MSDRPDNNQQSDSIYKAPTADTAVAPTDDLLAAYVGPKNASYYAQKFAKFAAGGGVLSWHWPAFFLTSFWVLYRKMWMWAAIYWLGIPIAVTVAEIALGIAIDPAVASLATWVAYLVIMFLVAPLIANFLYFKHAEAKVAKVGSSSMSAAQQAVELDRIGGTSKIVYVIGPLVVIFLVGVISAIAIPAYQDYTIRAQVSEGLSLAGGPKAAITESYERFQELPADNAAAGLVEPHEINGKYVDSIYVIDGDIEIVYGKDAHVLINGSAIILRPTPADGAVEWDCFSNEIMNKHLPAACRS